MSELKEKSGLNLRRGADISRGGDPEFLDDIGEKDALTPEEALAHQIAIDELLGGKALESVAADQSPLETSTIVVSERALREAPDGLEHWSHGPYRPKHPPVGDVLEHW